MRSRLNIRLTSLILFSATLTSASFANERVFSYTYQSNVLGKHQREIEVWNTLHLQRQDFYRRLRHRVEYEIGLGSGIQTAFYLNITGTASLSTAPVATINRQVDIGFSNEWKFKLSDPVGDAFGSALYAEIGVLPHEIELEGKVILDKHLGNTIHAINFVAEPEWEVGISGNQAETEYALGLEVDYGFAYRVDENWNLGLEIRSLSEYTSAKGWEYSTLFAGPAVAFRTSGFWMTLTVLPQVYAFKTRPGNANKNLELRSHERLETRLLFSFEL